MSDIEQRIASMARRARAAALKLSQLDRAAKDRMLIAMAAGLRVAAAEIVAANERDLAAAR